MAAARRSIWSSSSFCRLSPSTSRCRPARRPGRALRRRSTPRSHRWESSGRPARRKRRAERAQPRPDGRDRLGEPYLPLPVLVPGRRAQADEGEAVPARGAGQAHGRPVHATAAGRRSHGQLRGQHHVADANRARHEALTPLVPRQHLRKRPVDARREAALSVGEAERRAEIERCPLLGRGTRSGYRQRRQRGRHGAGPPGLRSFHILRHRRTLPHGPAARSFRSMPCPSPGEHAGDHLCGLAPRLVVSRS